MVFIELLNTTLNQYKQNYPELNEYNIIIEHDAEINGIKTKALTIMEPSSGVQYEVLNVYERYIEVERYGYWDKRVFESFLNWQKLALTEEQVEKQYEKKPNDMMLILKKMDAGQQASKAETTFRTNCLAFTNQVKEQKMKEENHQLKLELKQMQLNFDNNLKMALETTNKRTDELIDKNNDKLSEAISQMFKENNTQLLIQTNTQVQNIQTDLELKLQTNQEKLFEELKQNQLTNERLAQLTEMKWKDFKKEFDKSMITQDEIN